jgi:hypothetical protein
MTPWLATLALVVFASADAAPRAVVLVYERDVAARACADEATFRQAVADRLRREPWSRRSREAVAVHLERTRYGYAARVELWKDGERRGERELSSTGADCTPLVDAVVLATTLAIDPLHGMREESEPELREAPEPSIDPARRRRPLPIRGGRGGGGPANVSTDREGLTFELGAGGFVGIGATPGSLLGVTAHSAVRSDDLSLHLELRAELPGASPLPGGGQLGGSLLAAQLAPCLRFVGGPFLPNSRRAWASACGLVVAGAALVGADGIRNARGAASPWGGAGARLNLDIELMSALGARGYVEVVMPLLSVRLIDEVTGATLWEPPLATFAIGVQGLALLP